MTLLGLPNRGAATRLVLVRHAETEEAARGRLCGRLDVALGAAGRRQSDRLAACLAGETLAAVYSSPLARALETARPIAAEHGIEPLPVGAVRELDFGELEGMSSEEIEVRWPDVFRLWVEAPHRVRFRGGESLADLAARALPAVAEIRARHAGEAVALVTHGGVARVVLADALGLPPASVFRLDQAFAAVSVVDWRAELPHVRLVNWTADAPGVGRAR